MQYRHRIMGCINLVGSLHFELKRVKSSTNPACMGEQINKIVGRAAPEEFVEKLADVANDHHPDMQVDVMRAYHFGARFIVEVGYCMPLRLSGI